MNWISVKDCLPDREMFCWVATEDCGVFECYFSFECSPRPGFTLDILNMKDVPLQDITHWMPYFTPDPPQNNQPSGTSR